MASDMNRFLLSDERGQPLEDGVDVAGVGVEIEDAREIDAAGDVGVGANELAEVLLLVPGAQRVPLDEPVRLVAREPGVDEREQEPLAEEEVVARFEVAAHALRSNDEALDEPREA